MIFGRTTKNRFEWNPVFLFIPRKLVDGRWAWWHRVERCDYLANHISTGAIYSGFTGYCYREIPG